MQHFYASNDDHVVFHEHLPGLIRFDNINIVAFPVQGCCPSTPAVRSKCFGILGQLSVCLFPSITIMSKS